MDPHVTLGLLERAFFSHITNVFVLIVQLAPASLPQAEWKVGLRLNDP